MRRKIATLLLALGLIGGLTGLFVGSVEAPAQAAIPGGNMSQDEWTQIDVYIPNADTPPQVENICDCTGFLAGLGYHNGNPSKVIEYTSYLGAGWSDVYFVLRDADGKYHAWKKKICHDDGPCLIVDSSL